jgi:hypothetical protein
MRGRDRNRVDQDLGLLHAIDERLSVWGWETGTGVRFAIVLDMWGRDGAEGTGLGIKEGELKPVSVLVSVPCSDVLTATSLGIPGSADCIHQAAAESVLRPRRTHTQCFCRQERQLPHHEPQIHRGGGTHWHAVEARRHGNLSAGAGYCSDGRRT